MVAGSFVSLQVARKQPRKLIGITNQTTTDNIGTLVNDAPETPQDKKQAMCRCRSMLLLLPLDSPLILVMTALVTTALVTMAPSCN
jgi:hypothetical protein